MKFLFLLCLVISSSCGKNVGEAVADRDPIDNALADMDNGRWDDAISILQAEVGGSEDQNLVNSLLALAHAGKHGLDPLTYSLELTKSAEEGENEVTKTFSALPEATDENITGVKTASEFMDLIPNEQKSLENVFLSSMLYSAHFSLISKKFDTDGEGGLTLEELANLSADEAAAILDSLVSATDVLESTNLEGGDTDKASSKLSSIQDSIDESSGSTDAEKLQNYLSNQ